MTVTAPPPREPTTPNPGIPEKREKRMTAETRIRRQLVTERNAQTTIIEAAQRAHWMVAAFRPARTTRGWRTPLQGDPGYPDLTLAHPRGGVWFVELKRHPNKLTDEQAEWGKTLRLAGATWRLVYVPDELDSFCQELADIDNTARSRR